MTVDPSMIGKPKPSSTITATAELRNGRGQAGSTNPSVTSTTKPSTISTPNPYLTSISRPSTDFGTRSVNVSSITLTIASQEPSERPRSRVEPSSSNGHWNVKASVGLAVPVGTIGAVVTILYLLYRRKKIREKHEDRRRQEEKVRELYSTQGTEATENGPHELEARMLTKPYTKAELSEDARKRIAELSAEHLRELAANQIIEMPLAIGPPNE
ncbi:MAG: hypothetical protein Q9213_008360 [Squamulea squamosa]